jgi:hypothetical protein
MNAMMCCWKNVPFFWLWDLREFIFFSGPGNECSIKDNGMFSISRLQELLLTLATLIKRVCLSSLSSKFFHYNIAHLF